MPGCAASTVQPYDRALRRRVLARAPVAATLVAAALIAGAAGPARADLADELQTALNNLRGDEFTGTFSMSASGVNVEVTLLGFAFCTPPDPTAPPVANPTPSLNVYGCQNALVVSAVPTTGDTLALTVSAPEMFADLSITRDRTILCGEFGSGTRTDDAYLLTSFTAQAQVWTELVQGCAVYHLVPGSVQLALGTLDLHSDDPCAVFLSAFVGLLEPMLGAQAAAQIESILGTALRQRNHDVCGLVPDRAATWGSMKARFGRD